MNGASYDRKTGIITLTAVGFHTPEDIRERQRAVNALIDEAKANQGFARLLHLAYELPVQSPEVAEASTQAQKEDRLTGPRDKFAIVASAALVRLQLTRTIGSDKRKIFATEAEARAWLLEE